MAKKKKTKKAKGLKVKFTNKPIQSKRILKKSKRATLVLDLGN